MPTFMHLHKIVNSIDDAFLSFYDTMLSDSKLGAFFENDEQIQRLVKKQKIHFTQAIALDLQDIKESYIKLGEYHYDIRIPYIDFMKGADILQEHFLLNYVEADSSKSVMDDLFKFFKLMKSFTAKGYLNRMLQEDKVDIEYFFENSTESDTSYLPRDIVVNNIVWLKKLITAIENDEDFKEDINQNLLDQFETQAFKHLSVQKKVFFDEMQKRISINT